MRRAAETAIPSQVHFYALLEAAEMAVLIYCISMASGARLRGMISRFALKRSALPYPAMQNLALQPVSRKATFAVPFVVPDYTNER
jgi:hypothetical protein